MRDDEEIESRDTTVTVDIGVAQRSERGTYKHFRRTTSTLTRGESIQDLREVWLDMPLPHAFIGWYASVTMAEGECFAGHVMDTTRVVLG